MPFQISHSLWPWGGPFTVKSRLTFQGHVKCSICACVKCQGRGLHFSEWYPLLLLLYVSPHKVDRRCIDDRINSIRTWAEMVNSKPSCIVILALCSVCSLPPPIPKLPPHHSTFSASLSKFMWTTFATPLVRFQPYNIYIRQWSK